MSVAVLIYRPEASDFEAREHPFDGIELLGVFADDDAANAAIDELLETKSDRAAATWAFLLEPVPKKEEA